MDIVDKVKLLIKEKNISQKTLAEELGTYPANISDILKRKGRKFQTEHIPKLAKLFNVSESYLLGSDEIKIKTIPLIGLASCGVPNIAYYDDVEHIPVPAELARDGVYAVKAVGDSMLPKIHENDIIICDKEMECCSGNIVHYTTIDGESGLKKYLIDENNVVTLMPLNSDFKPIMCDKNDLRCARAIKIQADL